MSIPEWSEFKIYTVGDYVSYSAQTFQAQINNQGVPPLPTNNAWLLIPSGGVVSVAGGTNIAVAGTSNVTVDFDPAGGVDMLDNPFINSQYINTNGDIQIYKASPPTYRQVNTANGNGFEIVTNVETAMGASGPLVLKGNNNQLFESRLELANETAKLNTVSSPTFSLLKNSTAATASMGINASNNFVIAGSNEIEMIPALGRINVTGRIVETSLDPYPTTYYVSKVGNDTTGTGSQSNPFLTIQKAITVAEAAGNIATIFINTGSYTEDLIITKNISLIGIDLNIAFKDSVSSPTVNNVEIIGGITNTPVVAGAFTAQYITFTVPVNKQIVYNSASSVGQMNFQYCTITGTSAVNDGLSLILTNRHTHWFSNCRISKISATIGVPTIDGGTSSQASLFIISECRVQTRSSTDGIRAGAVQIYDSIVTAASGGTIIRLSGSSTTNSVISATQLQMNTVAGTFITNEKTVAVTIQMYNSQFLSFTALTGGVHYLVNNTSASSVALWFSNNKLFQSVGTPLNSTQMYTGLITFVDGVDIRPINMVNGNIINVSNINNLSGSVNIETPLLSFTGAALQSATSTGFSGQHLVITLNGVVYKIKLELP